MASRKQQLAALPIQLYDVVSSDVDKMLGPHKVLQQGDKRVVALNERQAKYYLTIGAISEQ